MVAALLHSSKTLASRELMEKVKCGSTVLTLTRYVSQYVVEGYKFYDQDLTLFLHRPCLDKSQTGKPGDDLDSKTPDLSGLEPFDISGGYVLQASIEAIDGNNPEIREKATQQLMAMKETLKQAVTLVPGDRLALDTRVPARR